MPGTERAIQIQRSASSEIVSVNVQGRWWWGEGDGELGVAYIEWDPFLRR